MDRNMYLMNAELNTFDLSAHSFMRDKILSCTIEKWPNFCEQMQPNLRGSLSLTMRQKGRRIYLLEIIQPFNVHHIQSKLNWNLKKLLTNNFNNQTLNWNWPNNSLICEQWMQQQQNKTAKRMALNSNFLYVDRSRCVKMYTGILSIHTMMSVWAMGISFFIYRLNYMYVLSEFACIALTCKRNGDYIWNFLMVIR